MSRPPDFSRDLNAEQLAAATHGDGPLLIVAGAGTGKTRTLVYRVAHLLRRGARPERILLLTFTRRAAEEMLGRVARLAGSGAGRVHGGTFHATAFRLLRAYGEQAGIARDFTILDQGDSEDLMGISRAALGFGERGSRFPRKETLHDVYSRHVNTEIPVATILETDLPAFADESANVLRVFEDYTARKAERNLVDYDDLLLFWSAMLDGSPEFADRIAGLYDHILVDEYQDTNVLQARILRGMCRRHSNITVVGDDAQSIYSFRGATIRNILDFPRQFEGAAVRTLEENYRSTQNILDASNRLIGAARERYAKKLWTRRSGGEVPQLIAAKDEHEQTRWVVERILELHENGTPLREMAVLFRAGFMSADLEIELTNRKIPFEKWGGIKFLEAAHVKDVLAFLRLGENPRDEVSWFRVLRLLPGVGDVTARAAIDRLSKSSWMPRALEGFKVSARSRVAFDGAIALVHSLLDSRPAPEPEDATLPGTARAAVAVEIARIRGIYDAILREQYDRPESRLADLDQLEMIASSFPSRSAFLAELALDPPTTSQRQPAAEGGEDDCLILSTVHSAKGREWDAVFTIWLVDGWFPSSRCLDDPAQVDEERRLLYVALTRARHHLFALYPVATNSGRMGGFAMDQLSRFLDRGVREHMLWTAAYPAPTPGVESRERSPDVPTDEPLLDLRALLRKRFSGS